MSNTNATTNPNDQTEQTYSVRIFRPHTHAGKRYAPGPDGVELRGLSKQEAAFISRVAGAPLHSPPGPSAPPTAQFDGTPPGVPLGPSTPRAAVKPQG